MQRRKRITSSLFALFTAVVLATAGCKTTEGFGEDVEDAGEEISESAEELAD